MLNLNKLECTYIEINLDIKKNAGHTRMGLMCVSIALPTKRKRRLFSPKNWTRCVALRLSSPVGCWYTFITRATRLRARSMSLAGRSYTLSRGAALSIGLPSLTDKTIIALCGIFVNTYATKYMLSFSILECTYNIFNIK